MATGGGGVVEEKYEIPEELANFKIFPKDEEEELDGNMPRDMVSAFSIFVRTNQINSAMRCKQCMVNMLDILKKGPDGSSKINIGQAVICWGCGFVGLPKNNPPPPTEGVPYYSKMPPIQGEMPTDRTDCICKNVNVNEL